MLSLKKEASNLSQDTVEIAACPICESVTTLLYYMQDAITKKRSKWYSCHCGVVWQADKPSAIYDAKYAEQFAPFDKKLRSAFEYPVRVYAPLIEEAIYGRKVLLIGTQTSHQENYFKERGWVTYTIDKNDSYTSSDRHFVGDFETYEFPPELSFNLIWIYHTLECFIQPKQSLKKCRQLLPEDGMLFIATPDTDFINTRSSSGFIHWKPQFNHIMWNKRSLVTLLENLGFESILNRRNYEQRFPAWDDLHVLAQKKFW